MATIDSAAMVAFNSAAVAVNAAAMVVGMGQFSSNGIGNSAAMAINSTVKMMAVAAGEGS